MNKRAAIAAMLEGKKICRKLWDSDEYLEMDSDGKIHNENYEARDINNYSRVGWRIFKDE